MKALYYITFLLVLTSSCKSYLDIKPYGKTIPKNSDEFASILHAKLNEIDYGADEVMIGNANTVANYESYADNLDASLTNYPAGNTLAIYAGSGINNMQAKYEKLYAIIRDCNIIITHLTSTASEQDRQVLGTAHTIRAVAYFNLLRAYCEPYTSDNQLGLSLVASFDMEEKPIRSTYKQTMEFIEADFTKAIGFNVTDPIYRYTQQVAKAYFARYYFWTKNWDNAIKYAAEIIPSYPLLAGADYVKMMQQPNLKSGSILFRSNVLSDQSSSISYTSIMGIIKARPASKEFADFFPAGSKDIRKSFYLTPKRESIKSLMAAVRAEEMYLILAESYAHKSNSTKALEYLDLLRSKRFDAADYVPYTSANLPAVDPNALIKVDATGNALTPLLHAILHERRLELFMEGDRWFELKRNGRPTFWVARDGRKYVTEAFLYTFPIPRTDVELIGGLVQNPGYTN